MGWVVFLPLLITPLLPPSSIISTTISLCVFSDVYNSASALVLTTPNKVWSQGTKLRHVLGLQG